MHNTYHELAVVALEGADVLVEPLAGGLLPLPVPVVRLCRTAQWGKETASGREHAPGLVCTRNLHNGSQHWRCVSPGLSAGLEKKEARHRAIPRVDPKFDAPSSATHSAAPREPRRKTHDAKKRKNVHGSIPFFRRRTSW